MQRHRGRSPIQLDTRARSTTYLHMQRRPIDLLMHNVVRRRRRNQPLSQDVRNNARSSSTPSLANHHHRVNAMPFHQQRSYNRRSRIAKMSTVLNTTQHRAKRSRSLRNGNRVLTLSCPKRSRRNNAILPRHNDSRPHNIADPHAHSQAHVRRRNNRQTTLRK